MNNTKDIGKSFQKLTDWMYYRYKGYRAEKLPNGNVLVVLKEMTIPEFHEFVDEMHRKMDESIARAFNKS